ncbi:hypothetical protein DFJ74DRAFT_707979 [Hyaloraphidium curvatum]|nr:hypothetical protein DFJ74DRAFT_707979 [Hyaloraphidium curvatum]
MSRTAAFRVCTLLLLACVLLPCAAAAPRSLFSELPPADEPPRPDARARRIRRVAADASLLRGDGPPRIALPLFSGANFTAVLDRRSGEDGRETWFGSLLGVDAGYVALSRDAEGSIIGTVVAGGAAFDIMPDGSGVHTLRELDLQAKPKCGTTGQHRGPGSQPSVAVGPLAADGATDGPLAANGASQMPAPAAEPGPDGIYTVDVLLAFTPAAVKYLGPSRNPDFVAWHDVQLANDAYRNSGIPMRVRLVHVARTAYVERDYVGIKGPSDFALEDLTNTTDGRMDELHALRDQYGADLVALYANFEDYCGFAHILEVPGAPGNAAKGFSVISITCIADTTLAHEMGHNMGCWHDRETAGADKPGASAAAFPYAYGYRVPGVFRTVMAYECETGGVCPTVPYFSNPDVLFAGRRTGIANRSDNARAIRNLVAEFSAYRAYASPSPLPAPPPPPSGFLSMADCGRNRTCCGHPDDVFRNLTLAACETKCRDVFCQLVGYDPGPRTCRIYSASRCPYGRWTASPRAFLGARDPGDCPVARGCPTSPPPPPPPIRWFGDCAANTTCCGTPSRVRTVASRKACEDGCQALGPARCKFASWEARTKTCREFASCARWTPAPGVLLSRYILGLAQCPTAGCPARTALRVEAARGRRGARVNLRATLARIDGARTNTGRPVSDAQVSFRVNGTLVGRARTNAAGLASLAFAVLRTMRVGNAAIAASFGGNGTLLASGGSAKLTVKP